MILEKCMIYDNLLNIVMTILLAIFECSFTLENKKLPSGLNFHSSVSKIILGLNQERTRSKPGLFPLDAPQTIVGQFRVVLTERKLKSIALLRLKSLQYM